MDAQEEMRQIQRQITQYVSKTLELGHPPAEEDLSGGGLLRQRLRLPSLIFEPRPGRNKVFGTRRPARLRHRPGKIGADAAGHSLHRGE